MKYTIIAVAPAALIVPLAMYILATGAGTRELQMAAGACLAIGMFFIVSALFIDPLFREERGAPHRRTKRHDALRHRHP